MKRYGLRDDQFARIEALLPGRPGTVGRSSELGNRLFVEAVIWKLRSGAPPSPGNAMAAKTTPQKAKRKNASETSKASPPPAAASALSMATQNLINMIAVSAVSGTVLLGLLAAKHF